MNGVARVFSSGMVLERPTTESESLVRERNKQAMHISSSRAGPEKPRLNLGALTSKAKYYSRSIVNEYREGKVKSIPVREMKEFLKPCR